LYHLQQHKEEEKEKEKEKNLEGYCNCSREIDEGLL
jgi:hypothetical protein